jgi:hypothetical protein
LHLAYYPVTSQLFRSRSRVDQKVGLVIDEAPPNSKRWADAVREARAVATECLRLARLTGDPDLIAEAERTAAILPTP